MCLYKKLRIWNFDQDQILCIVCICVYKKKRESGKCGNSYNNNIRIFTPGPIFVLVKVEWILFQDLKSLLTWVVGGIIRSAFLPSQTRARNLHGMVRVVPALLPRPTIKQKSSPPPSSYWLCHFSIFAY